MDRSALSLVPNDPERVYCTHCKGWKARSEFYEQTQWCKDCRKQAAAEYRRDPAIVARYRFRYANDRTFRANEICKRVKKRARMKGLEFDLDVQWVEENMEAGCALSGLPFDFSSEGLQPYGPSVDRIQAGGGYTKRNCRMVLVCVNMALMDWGFESFLLVVKAIAERNR